VLNSIDASAAFWLAALSWLLRLLKHASILREMERSADSGKIQGPATIAVPNSIDASSLSWLARLP
jgi:hypothetical protein